MAMGCEDQDKMKVDPKNIIDIEQDDVPDDRHQALEAYRRHHENGGFLSSGQIRVKRAYTTIQSINR